MDENDSFFPEKTLEMEFPFQAPDPISPDHSFLISPEFQVGGMDGRAEHPARRTPWAGEVTSLAEDRLGQFFPEGKLGGSSRSKEENGLGEALPVKTFQDFIDYSFP